MLFPKVLAIIGVLYLATEDVLCAIGGNVRVVPCAGVTSKAQLTAVNVSPCTERDGKSAFCFLVKGSTSNISISFVPNEAVSAVKSVVHGKIGIVPPVPFPLPNPNGCVNSGLQCPLTSGSTQHYHTGLQIKEEYPKVKVIITWELKDQDDNDLLCFRMMAKIVDGEGQWGNN